MSGPPPVAIVGWGGVFPGGTTKAELWAHLRNGRDAATEPPDGRWCREPATILARGDAPAPDGVRSTKACFVRDPTPSAATGREPVVDWLVAAAQDALGAPSMGSVDPRRVGVVIGSIMLPTASSTRWHERVLRPTLERSLGVPIPRFGVGGSSRARWASGGVAGTVARTLGLGGPHAAIDAACASTYFALAWAVRALQRGEVDAMLAGGASRADSLYTQVGFSQLRALSASGRCAPFDARADGLVVGDGAGVFVLKRLDDARRDRDEVLAVIRGLGLGNDLGGALLAPNTLGQRRAIEAAYREAAWMPAEIDLVECHATGTPVGDATEFRSLLEVWREHGVAPARCALGAVKANVGHLLTGAGAAALAKVLLSFAHREIPPLGNFERPAPAIQLAGSPFFAPREPTPWPRTGRPARAALSGFGFGGTNAHVLVEAGPGEERSRGHVAVPSWPDAAPQPVGRPTADRAEPVAIVAAQARVGRLTGLALREAWGDAAPLEPDLGALHVPIGAFKIPPRDLERARPQQVLALLLARDVLRDVTRPAQPEASAVFLGTGLDPSIHEDHLRFRALADAPAWAAELGVDPTARERFAAALADAICPPLDPERTLGGLASVAASRIAHEYGCAGPAFVMSSEEASGFTALGQAVAALQRGELELALVGAIDCGVDPHVARALDEVGDPSSPRDAGVMFVLKRLAAARRDGDRVLGVVHGVGETTGGRVGEVSPCVEAQIRAIRAGLSAGGQAAHDVEAVFLAHDGAPPDAARQARALTTVYGPGVTLVPNPARGSCGHASAFVALYAALTQPRGATPAGPVAVHATSGSGATAHLVLAAPDPSDAVPIPPKGAPALFVVEGDDEAALDRGLRALAEQLATGGALQAIARRFYRAQPPRPQARLGIALLAHDRDALRRSLDRGAASLLHDPPAGVFATANPLGPSGALAWVFPGSGNGSAEDGLRLATDFPRARHRLLTRVPGLAERWPGPVGDHRDAFVERVAAGVLAAEVAREFGLRPNAAIGHSLGETTALIATGVWTRPEVLLVRVLASSLFSRDLAGEFAAARAHWNLPPDAPVRWTAAAVERDADTMRRAIEALCVGSHVAVLIVDGPRSCVLGGEAGAVERVLRHAEAKWHPLTHVASVHCDIARAVEPAYRDLHDLPTAAPEGLRIYSGAWSSAYVPTSARVAEALAASATRTVEFAATIEQAHRDGVRVFLELGPGASCTRKIAAILQGRPHLAVALGETGQDGWSGVVRALAVLVSHRVPVDLRPLFAGGDEASPDEGPALEVAGHRAPWRVPPLPIADAGQALAHPTEPAPAGPSAAPAGPSAAPDVAGASPLLGLVQATASAHGAYLQVATARLRLLQRAMGSAHAAPPGDVAIPTAFDRAQCLAFAVGTIAEVLGPAYADVDAHPTRVRLPDEPLMLVDRIVQVEGAPGELGPGRVVTEHDVLQGAWYLDAGRMPICIAVEAGQADLFLSAYLGIDARTRGLAMYRLLDATVEFHAPLPRPGTTVRYDIRIERFFRQGDAWLFRFRFDAVATSESGSVPLMSMRDGCAGFFTALALAAGKGVVPSPVPPTARAAAIDPRARFCLPTRRTLDRSDLDALRGGDLTRVLGDGFRPLGIADPVTIPTRRMALLDRITALEPSGGPWGGGRIVGEYDLDPDAWFLTCHFVDDPVMPGTLMYECCLHTLRVLLLGFGWIGDRDTAGFEPVTGIRSRLECRGQVLPTTRTVGYELLVRELGFQPEDETPYVIADALMFADGKPIVRITDLSLRLQGSRRAELERMHAPVALGAPRPAVYGRDKILAFAEGHPSEAFGEPYRIFDAQRRIARLPRPPFALIDRITEVHGRPFVMEAGARAQAQFALERGAWYFAEARQSALPFAILLEIALQPCGWLAAYVGSALHAEHDLRFRNLGGAATLLAPIGDGDDLITTDVRLERVSASGGMILQHFAFECTAQGRGPVYRGTTYFGYFSERALAQQVGLREAPAARGPAPTPVAHLPTQPPFPLPRLRMVDAIEALAFEGGRHGLGWVRGSIRVDPGAWFFAAHFYQDPVWPGSLGLQAFLQLLSLWLHERFSLRSTAQLATITAGVAHRWEYRGQVIPSDREVVVEADITGVDPQAQRVFASGTLWIDGRPIYALTEFGMEVIAP